VVVCREERAGYGIRALTVSAWLLRKWRLKKIADEACSGGQKCCFDGCINSCLNPRMTTECLHAEAAAHTIARLAPNNIFVVGYPVILLILTISLKPACEADGSFRQIQRHGSSKPLLISL